MSEASGGSNGGAPLREGEWVLVRRKAGDATLLRLTRGPQSIEGRGVVDLTSAVGAAPGATVSWGGAPYRVVRPSIGDLVSHVRRRAQIVTPKDAQYLLYLAGVAPGSLVLEAGAGSGALTLVLANAVGPHGRVRTYDRRHDFLDVARGNVARADLLDRVEFIEADVTTDGFGVTGATGVLLDLPEPWAALAHARTALVPGGSIATYTPTYNQLERTARELRTAGFEDIRSVELLERAIHVGEGGTRPEFEMLGHTGFLTGARWMGGPW